MSIVYYLAPIKRYENEILIPIKTLNQLEELRKIRNSCKDFMTRNKNEISEQDQISWYRSTGDDIKLFLLTEIHHGVIICYVGYGLLKIESDRVLLSGGLGEAFRDKGLGKILFRNLIEESKKYNLSIILEVLVSNNRARKVYESLGFQYFDTDGDIMMMEYKGD